MREKPSKKEIDDRRRILQLHAQPLLDEILASIRKSGGIEMDHASWIAFLDFLERDMAIGMMKKMNEAEPTMEQCKTQAEFTKIHEAWEKAKQQLWSQFETLSEGRALMGLDNYDAGVAFIKLMTAYASVSQKASNFFKVKPVG